MAASAQDQHRVHVLVPLQGREAAGRDLEIAQLRVQVRVCEQHLPGHRLEQRARVLLVGKELDPFPVVIALGLAMDFSLADHGLRPYGYCFTAATKAAVSSTRRSRAASRPPPISNMMSAP